MAGPAPRLSGVHGPDHGPDAGGDAAEARAAEDRHAARSRADRAAAAVQPVSRAVFLSTTRFAKRSQTRHRDGCLSRLRRFARFLETEYLPACYDGAGIWQAPEGARLYADFARSFTTTGLTPDETSRRL
ncbi:MAG: DUF885 family protein, partial [Acidobacteriaceae bacterium]|nr:DUF885 family protein [Acidobacteriaceae bacterium]